MCRLSQAPGPLLDVDVGVAASVRFEAPNVGATALNVAGVVTESYGSGNVALTAHHSPSCLTERRAFAIVARWRSPIVSHLFKISFVAPGTACRTPAFGSSTGSSSLQVKIER